jgi:hypothetical protein
MVPLGSVMVGLGWVGFGWLAGIRLDFLMEAEADADYDEVGRGRANDGNAAPPIIYLWLLSSFLRVE